jgi:dihydroflavonol-4-reductase
MRALKAAKSAGIKRVVLTSSMVSMLGNADKSIKIDSKSWTNVKGKNVSAYAKSKTLAEQAAWDFINTQSDASKMELVVVNPGPVFGPSLSGRLVRRFYEYVYTNDSRKNAYASSSFN